MVLLLFSLRLVCAPFLLLKVLSVDHAVDTPWLSKQSFIFSVLTANNLLTFKLLFNYTIFTRFVPQGYYYFLAKNEG